MQEIDRNTNLGQDSPRLMGLEQKNGRQGKQDRKEDGLGMSTGM